MIKVPDALSLAAMRALEGLLGRKVGGSTGTNFVGALQVMGEMKAKGETGAVVTLICDGGERYLDTYYDDAWLAAQGLAPSAAQQDLIAAALGGASPARALEVRDAG
jgi:cysteine synthase A